MLSDFTRDTENKFLISEIPRKPLSLNSNYTNDDYHRNANKIRAILSAVSR